ncbi:hypothetical protein GF340_00165 [Candidatus Peregrinibacteria bacterium]|nr:hypothetical protein [Candidatus Peregrinibacteria bacterium]
MNLLTKKQKRGLNIFHLEFGFLPEQISDWVDNNFKSDLLDNKKLIKDNDWTFQTAIKYYVDIISHNDDFNVIYYHRHNNKFSNYLNAYEYFDGNFYKKFPYLKNKIRGFNLELHQTGIIGINLYLGNKHQEAEKNIIAVPVNEISRIQQGQHALNSDNLSYKQLTQEIDEEETLEFNISTNETIKIKRTFLGLEGQGVGYRNAICYVKAYPTTTSTDYSSI